MARRGRLTEVQVSAYAREAVQRVTDSDDPDEEARRILREAPDNRTREATVEMSAAAPDRITGAFVTAAVESGDERLARTAADLLLDTSGSPYAFAVLQKCLQSSDSLIRARAAEGLETFDDPDVVRLLDDALNDDASSVRTSATATLSMIVGTPHHPLRGALIQALSKPEDAITRAIVSNDDEQVRRQAVQGLAYAGSNAILPTLRALSRDEDAEVRQEVVLALSVVSTDDAMDLVGQMVDDPSHRVASTALDVLAAELGSGSAAFLSYLQKAVAHPAAEVRRHAVLMLDRYASGEVADALHRASTDEDFEVARRAGEILRRVAGSEELGWLSSEMSDQQAAGQAFSVWEAGNIGLEAGAARKARGTERAEDIGDMLEKTLSTGAPSARVHAVNELVSLVDIGDSPAMQQALNDSDPAVRSRAADALSYTRDAGLLVSVLRNHPDGAVRRRAVEALAENPGGRREAAVISTRISFSSTRTLGMGLYGFFLKALRDEDAGVVQTACATIREYAQTVSLCPVRPTLAELERVAGDDEKAFLLQEEAARAAETVEGVDMAGFIAGIVDDVLGWRGELARQAHAVEWEGGEKGFRIGAAVAEETFEEWCGRYRLGDEERQAVRQAFAGQGCAEPQAVGRLLLGLTRDLECALECVAHAARALAYVGQEEARARLEKWSKAVASGPALNWGRGNTVDSLKARIDRQRKRAWTATVVALDEFEPGYAGDRLKEAAEDEDDWVRIVALAAVAETAGDVDADLLSRLVGEHAGEEDFAYPVGAGALQLLRRGVGDACEPMRQALTDADVDLRLRLTHELLVAAQEDNAGEALTGFLRQRDGGDLGDLCIALALRGAGRLPDDLSVPQPGTNEADPEPKCARLALDAMDSRTAAVERLEEYLRSGDSRQRYSAAYYLALSRAYTSTVTFASVRDQDVPAMLRAVCAAALVESGFTGGRVWFEKAVEAASSDLAARVTMRLCAAIENAVPLMLDCRDVNVGRFV